MLVVSLMNSYKVLIITNKEDITVDFVVQSLKARNVQYYRFNTEDIGFVTSISFCKNGYVLHDQIKGIAIDLNSFDSVYFRRPKLPAHNLDLTAGEQHFFMLEVSTLLEGIYRSLSSKFWLNSVFDIRMLENKPYQLQVAKSLDFLIPDFFISNDPQLSKSFALTNTPCIFKPLKAGIIEEPIGLGHVLYTTKVDALFLEKIVTNGNMPIYLQKQIEKDSDIRVTVVGDTVFGAKIISQNAEDSKIDWRKSQSLLNHEKIDLPEMLQDKCLKLCKKFNLNFAAIDFILDKKGDFWFLEINPNGQWAWIEGLLGYPISHEIAKLLVSGGHRD